MRLNYSIKLIVSGIGIYLLYLFLPEEYFLQLLYLESDILNVSELQYLVFITAISLVTLGGVLLYFNLKYGEDYLSRTNLKGQKTSLDTSLPSKKRILQLAVFGTAIFIGVMAILYIVFFVSGFI